MDGKLDSRETNAEFAGMRGWFRGRAGRLANVLRWILWRLPWHAARIRTQIRFAIDKSHELPPGSIGPYCMRGLKSDDKFYTKLQKKHGSIFKLFWGSRDLKICLVGFGQGRRLLANHGGILRRVNTDISPVVPHGYLRSMGGDIHARYRRAFAGALRDDLVDAWADMFRHTIRIELTRLSESNQSDASAHCLIETLNQISTRSLFSLIFGVEPTSGVSDNLYDLYCELGPKGYIEDVGRIQADIYKNIRRQISQIHLAVRNDSTNRLGESVLSRLVADIPDSELDETLIGNAIYMVERGRHDLRDLLRWIVKYLSDDPSTIAELRTDTGQSDGTFSLAQACVMETLRLDQAETVNRQATEAFDFEGYHVPKDSWVSVLLRETHRNAEVFDEPDCFRPRRFLENSYSANEYSPFGLDAHQCIAGSFVTRIGAIFVDELAKGFRWEVVDDGPRHWGHSHWQPARSFAIRLAKRK